MSLPVGRGRYEYGSITAQAQGVHECRTCVCACHVPDATQLQNASSKASRRTPTRIEDLLRRYNKEGVTRWTEILERLRTETPSIELTRTTLGVYLKECNIGTSRRNNMKEDEIRELIQLELNTRQGRKRGVRNIWSALKSKGHHIKRDLVEKVMKEIDPDGFAERRPKWKSLQEIALAAAVADPYWNSPVSSHPYSNKQENMDIPSRRGDMTSAPDDLQGRLSPTFSHPDLPNRQSPDFHTTDSAALSPGITTTIAAPAMSATSGSPKRHNLLLHTQDACHDTSTGSDSSSDAACRRANGSHPSPLALKSPSPDTVDNCLVHETTDNTQAHLGGAMGIWHPYKLYPYSWPDLVRAAELALAWEIEPLP